MKETSAKGVKGYLLFEVDKKGNKIAPFFRVYHKNRTFTDYQFDCYDLTITITDELSFLEKDNGEKTLDYSFRYLKIPPRSDKPTAKQIKQHLADRKKKATLVSYVDGKRIETITTCGEIADRKAKYEHRNKNRKS